MRIDSLLLYRLSHTTINKKTIIVTTTLLGFARRSLFCYNMAMVTNPFRQHWQPDFTPSFDYKPRTLTVVPRPRSNKQYYIWLLDIGLVGLLAWLNIAIFFPPHPPSQPWVSVEATPSPIVHRQAFAFVNPLPSSFVTSRFGKRGREFHEGEDLGAPQGAEILASAAGTVSYSGWRGGYGKLIILKHPHGMETRYGHCSKLLVHPGQSIVQGQKIALVGQTGHATGPHLHFEVRKEEEPINPEPFLRKPPGNKDR